jgi:hypothetical protein
MTMIIHSSNKTKIVSRWEPSSSGYGHWDYLAAQKLVTDLHLNPPFAIVVGTFELNMEFWRDRNVLGRLLAIRMGVSSPTTTKV